MTLTQTIDASRCLGRLVARRTTEKSLREASDSVVLWAVASDELSVGLRQALGEQHGFPKVFTS